MQLRGSGPQPPIGDYAAIGDCRSLALVSRWGSIDWFCAPIYSSPSVFAALLDSVRGGRFALAPAAGTLVQPPVQAYLAGSNVLRTRSTCQDGALEVTDFMTMPEAGGFARAGQAPQDIVRLVRCVAGSVELAGEFSPRPGYAADEVALERRTHCNWTCRSRSATLGFSSTLPFQLQGPSLVLRTRLRAGEQHVALLHTPAHAAPDGAALVAEAQGRLAATLGWWRAWCRRCRDPGRYTEAVQRSALALKLLTDRPTGAVVAAGTTSLPEGGTGDRNWDYRYCWLRDSSLVLNAFIDLGYGGEADAFLRWLLHATRSTQPRLQVVYQVHGQHLLPEQVLPQLRGYRGVGPVRIGNAASAQVQNDIYGEVLLTAWEHARRGGTLDENERKLLAGFAGVVCDIWRQPDQGIWEIRLPPRHNTHSKLMCWAALDRSLQLQASHGGLPIDRERVLHEREAIRADIEAHGFDPAVNSYVGYYGSQAPDASLLMIPRLGYLPATHPRVAGTVRHVFEQLSVHGLLDRYPPDVGYDGVPGPEHLFVICNFWAVDCLARQGRLQEARALYEHLLSLRNHVGLYAEEFTVQDGRPTGNFPQAFSHVGLITAGLSLAAAQRERHAAAAEH